MTEINLIQNGEFAGELYPFRNDERLKLPAGWAPWWGSQRDGDPAWKNQLPEFGATVEDGVPLLVVRSPFATHTAGLMQQQPAAADDRYELVVDAKAWSSEAETPGELRESSDVNVQVGIDPTGGLDPFSPLVQWSKPAQPLGHWQTIRLVVQAQANLMTVFLKSAPALPKRQQSVFWRGAMLRPLGKYRRTMTVVGLGDTHITLKPAQPQPGEQMEVLVSANRNHIYVDLQVAEPDGAAAKVTALGYVEEAGRHLWRYQFVPEGAGVYDIRFVGDQGARLLAQQLLRVSTEAVLAAQAREAPSGQARVEYQRVYVLLPPTADVWWFVAAARGSFDGRYTIGFSADDAGVGELAARHVLAVNPHHWPEPLSASWFHSNYPGTTFTALVANSPEDLESWLKNWDGEG